MTQYIKQDTNKPSEMMWDSGLPREAPEVQCGCGKDHSVSFDDNGEYDITESVEYIDFYGQFFVYGCEGCEQNLLKYERFIWHNRDTIRRYLKTRVDQEKDWADQEKLLNTIAGI